MEYILYNNSKSILPFEITSYIFEISLYIFEISPIYTHKKRKTNIWNHNFANWIQKTNQYSYNWGQLNFINQMIKKMKQHPIIKEKL